MFFSATAGLVLTIVFIAIYYSSMLIKSEVEYTLNSLADDKVKLVNKYVNDKKQATLRLANREVIVNTMQDMSKSFYKGVNSDAYLKHDKNLRQYLGILEGHVYSYDLLLVNTNGDIVFSVEHESDFATNLLNGAYQNSNLADVFNKAKASFKVSMSTFDVYKPSQWRYKGYGKGKEQHSAFIAAPVFKDKKLIGVLAIQLSSNDYFHLATDYTGIKETGEIVITKLDDKHALVIAPLRRNPDAAFNLRFPIGSDIALPIQKSVLGKHGSGISIGYEDTEILAAWRHVPELEWGIVVKIETAEAFKEANEYLRVFLLLSLIGVMVVFVVLLLINPNNK